MIELTREVRFAVPEAADVVAGAGAARGRNSWAGWPRAVGAAAYWTARLTASGTPEPRTGYLVDIKRLDDLVRGPGLDALAQWVASSRAGHDPGHSAAIQCLGAALFGADLGRATLTRIELSVTPFLRFGMVQEERNVVTMTQQFEFSAAHRLHAPELSDDENRRVFGKCNYPNGHGHNYVVDVTISQSATDSAAQLPVADFEQRVAEHVIERFDHKHLNIDCAEFERLNPTVENIAQVIWERLVEMLRPARLLRVRVYETPKTWADYSGG